MAAGGIATKNIDAFSVYAGLPVKIIAERNRELEYHLEGKTFWHFY